MFQARCIHSSETKETHRIFYAFTILAHCNLIHRNTEETNDNDSNDNFCRMITLKIHNILFIKQSDLLINQHSHSRIRVGITAYNISVPVW